MRQLKPWSAREHLIIHLYGQLFVRFLALSTQQMSSPSRKCVCGVSPRLYLVVFVFGVNQKNYKAGRKYKTPNINGGKLLRGFSSSYGKLLDSVTFRILSNINDGATLRKYVERLQMIALMMVILMVFYTYGELILRGVDPILGNGQKHPPKVFFTKRCSQKFRKIHRKKSVTEKHFPVDFAKFLRKTFFQNISERLLLNGYGVQGQLL